MTVTSKKFPRELDLLDGRTVPIATVHYAIGNRFYRVSYQGADRPLGCIAFLESDAFVERTAEVLRDESRRILSGNVSEGEA